MKYLKIGVTAILLAVIAYAVVSTIDFAELAARIRQLSVETIAILAALLLLNALAAAFRLKILSTDLGHEITFGRAVAALSSGNLLGSIFFQLPGQLIARGSILARQGVPFAAVATMTIYEKLGAAFVSGLLALGGAALIFGYVFVDRGAGGFDLIKIVVGLLSAAMAGAILGYGKMLIESTLPHLDRGVAGRVIRMFGLNLLVQLPMLGAFVITAQAFAPSVSTEKLAAAAAIVMFAANIPISLSGWGVRELSSVFALGAIGVPMPDAVVSSVIIGAGSTLVLAILAVGTVGTSTSEATQRVVEERQSLDYGKLLAWALPLTAATLVFFQVYIPVSSGTLLNVNLADPVALLGSALFILGAIRAGRQQMWRYPYVNRALLVFSLVLTAGLAIGALMHGWTQWAWVNRYIGWFILVAYMLTGALAIRQFGERAFTTLLLTFCAACAAIVMTEFVFIALSRLGMNVPIAISPTTLQGFAQNRNFFAFQILIAFAAALVIFPPNTWVRRVVLLTLAIGLILTGSRSGWITMGVLLVGAYYFGAIRARKVTLLACIGIGGACILAYAVWVASTTGPAFSLEGSLWPNKANTDERLRSILVGLDLFWASPLYGKGLGAFRSLNLPSSATDIPLLIHSTAVWLLAELGLIGLLTFAVPLAMLFLREFRTARTDPRSQLVLFCLLVFFVMSLPADMTYQRTFWLMLGAGLALHFSGTRETQPS